MGRVVTLGLIGLALLAGQAAGAPGAVAAEKMVLLPFDLILQKKEEDFFIGAGKPKPEEVQRLKVVNDELRAILSKDTRYELLDTGPIAKEITDAAPIYDCNGCEVDLAKKLGGKVVYTGVIDKASETLLNMRIAEIDVESGQLRQAGSVVIQGNTEEAWLRAVRWIMKNRLAQGAKP